MLTLWSFDMAVCEDGGFDVEVTEFWVQQDVMKRLGVGEGRDWDDVETALWER